MVENTDAEAEGEWKCVDARPFECPNGCGLLEVESELSVWCPDCSYVRTVMEWEPAEEEI